MIDDNGKILHNRYSEGVGTNQMTGETVHMGIAMWSVIDTRKNWMGLFRLSAAVFITLNNHPYPPVYTVGSQTYRSSIDDNKTLFPGGMIIHFN